MFVRFLGEFQDTKKSFRNYLTFSGRLNYGACPWSKRTLIRVTLDFLKLAYTSSHLSCCSLLKFCNQFTHLLSPLCNQLENLVQIRSNWCKLDQIRSSYVDQIRLDQIGYLFASNWFKSDQIGTK